ncbi:MAG: RagB/SusD family nutrient uptake outer membrane protein [Bacteroidales bacterium]|nr:RagB/SusD family nutrient uptake outer membrane protein [Bacteroidales bacterium]
MKKLNKILALALGTGAMLSVQSCSEDFLDVDHYDVLSADYISSSDENFENGILSCYALMNQVINDESMKPWLWMAGHPTMDTQATGWDKAWLTQDWPADQKELYTEWRRLYEGITLCNNIIRDCKDDQKTANLSDDLVENAMAEARAMRGFYYFLAAQTWGNIPIIKEEPDTEDLPDNGGEEGNAVKVLDYIIEDLSEAAKVLDWKPRNGQYGRATKGMAKAFLAEAYLWKAYRQGNASGPGAEVDAAKAELKEIIESGTYELQESFTTLFDPLAWNKESIWEEVMEEGSTKAWEGFHTNAHGWTDNYAACPDNGGWGTLYLSWEFYSCFEKGDKRRDASACIPTIDNWGDYKDRITDEPLEVSAKSDYCYGVNPYLDEVKSKYKSYHYNTGGDYAPGVWSLKWWRTGVNTWWSNMWNPVHIYWKRYADVLLTYAECCFRTGDESEGWDYVNMIRKRAFGELEDGKSNELTTKYVQYYRNYAADRSLGMAWEVDHFDNYPIPFGSNMADYVPGEDYYDMVKTKLGFNLETWQVAMIQERRKEFNCEWTLAPALHREGLLAEHIRVNYPKDDHAINEGLYTYPWTPRTYDYSEDKMNFPIPAQELIRNPNLTQNKAYR